jgi:hypothetical protein
VYGETRGELMTELWTYWYQRQIGDPYPECLSIGKNDMVHFGDHNSTCTIKTGRPVLWGFSATCDTQSAPPWYAVTEADQIRCAREALHRDLSDYVKLAVDGLAPTTVSTLQFEVASRQFTFITPVNAESGYAPGLATASAYSWVAMIYLALGHHVVRLLFKGGGEEEHVITKTVDVVP